MRDKIIAVCITNPFEPLESRIIEYLNPPLKVSDVIFHFSPGTTYEPVVAVNGSITESYDTTLQAGDSIVVSFYPKGGRGEKNILSVIAMIAVVVAAGWIGATVAEWAAAKWGLGAAAQYAIQVGVTGIAALAGAYIVNAVLPYQLPTDELDSTLKSSPTYSWEPVDNPSREGGVLPIVYGEMKVTPPCVGRYVETCGNDQYLNLLFAVAGHKVDSISDIKINDVPITYFSGVEVETRLGDINQTPIKYFTHTYSDVPIGVELSTSYCQRTTQGNTVNEIGIGLVFPYGLFYANDSGGLDPQTVTVEIEYKKASDSDWTSFGTFEITEAESSAVRKFYRITDLEASQYDVRVRLTSELPQGPRYRNQVFWEYMQEVVYESFSYPGVSLLALRILATDQLSGRTPRVTCVVTRSTVKVPINGSYYEKPANNPAWVAYDMLHSELGGNVPERKLHYQKFDEWATFCSTKGYTCNIYFDSPMNLKRALDIVSTLGRGAVIQIGDKFSCVFDSDSLPVQRFLFGMGNIAANSFSEEWTSHDDRANVIEVTYYDADYDYTPQTIVLEQEGIDDTVDRKPLSINLVGCTSRQMALKHAKYLLKCNRYLTNTVSFEADVEAIACLPGDIIEVSHDAPQWGISGRIVSSTSDTVKLDRKVTLIPGKTYVVQVQNIETDSIEAKTVQSVSEIVETDTLSLTSSFQVIPPPLSNYQFGEQNRVSKLMRVIAITRAQDQRRRITCLEHIPEVYDDSVTYPTVYEISDLPGVVPGSLVATEITRVGRDGSSRTVIVLTWRGTAIKWYVFMTDKDPSVHPDSWRFVGVAYRPIYEIENVIPGKRYWFHVSDRPSPKVVGTPPYVDHGGETFGVLFPGGLEAQLLDDCIVLKWTKSQDVNVVGYNIYLNDQLIAYCHTANVYIYKGPLSPGTYNFKVVALNKSYKEGQYATISVYIPYPPGITYVSVSSRPFQITLTANVTIPEGGVMEVWCSTENDRETAELIAECKSPRFVHTGLPMIATRYYWLRIRDKYGNYSSWYPEGRYNGIMAQTSTDPSEYLQLLWGSITEEQLTQELTQKINGAAAQLWDSSVGYSVGDIVAHEGNFYRCIQAYSPPPPHEPGKSSGEGYWELLGTAIAQIEERLTNDEATISLHTGQISNLQSTASNHESRISTAEVDISAGKAGNWSSISEKLSIATYNSEQKDQDNYLRVAALENRFQIYDTTNVPYWSYYTTYYPGHIVKYGSSYYRCIRQCYNVPPTNSYYWTQITQGLVTQWTLRMNANGRVAGIGMMLDSSSGSEMVILADKFKVMRPDEQGNPVQVFVAGTINGVNSVGISGNAIIDGALLARHVGTNEIIANSANIRDGVITNAKIVNLNAEKITAGYLSVDRIQVNSITMPVGSYIAGAISNPLGVVVSVGITTTGQKIAVSVSCRIDAWTTGDYDCIWIEIKRDSTVLYGAYGRPGQFAATILDQPSAGSYTYSLNVYFYGYQGYVTNRSIVVTEMRR